MTARDLRKAVVQDLRDLFKHDQFKTPDGGMASPGVYAQALPYRQIPEGGGAVEQDDPFPYIIVRIDSGNIESQTAPHKVALILLVGIFEDSLENNGDEAVLEIIERIQQHYEETPALNEFVCTDPFSWALQDEPSYPYYFGAINVTFDAPAPRAKWSDLV